MSGEADILWGYKAIGEHVGLSARQAKWRADQGELPTFKSGKTVCARRSTIAADMAAKEVAARRSEGSR